MSSVLHKRKDRWDRLEKIQRVIRNRLYEEAIGRGEEGTYDTLINALGFDDGMEVCILWWCKSLTLPMTYWCLKHGDEWGVVYREARK